MAALGMVCRRARVWYAGKEFFDSQLKPIFNVGLIDPIYSIRQACIAIIKDMSDIFGPEWTVAHLVRISPITLPDPETRRNPLRFALGVRAASRSLGCAGARSKGDPRSEEQRHHPLHCAARHLRINVRPDSGAQGCEASARPAYNVSLALSWVLCLAPTSGA